MLALAPFSKTLLYAALALAVSSTDAQDASAAPPFKLLQPTILGSGCKPGTAWAEVSGDGQAISVLFSEFAANTDPNTSRMRRTCNFALPVEAMPGKSIGFYRVDFRGWAYVPPVEGATGTFLNEYFFAGQVGPSAKKTYNNGTDEPIFDSVTIEVQSTIWSPCGGSTNFRINSALTASRPVGSAGDVQMQIDSLDATVSGHVQVFVEWRDCNATSTTYAPTMPVPTTPTPAPTPVVTTLASTPAPSTPVPSTPAPSTPAPSTPAPTTPKPTPQVLAPTPVVATLAPPPVPATTTPTTPAPTTPMPTTPVPTTPAPTTPAPTTPAPTTPMPTTPIPSTPAPTTESPTTFVPITPTPTTPPPTTVAPPPSP